VEVYTYDSVNSWLTDSKCRAGNPSHLFPHRTRHRRVHDDDSQARVESSAMGVDSGSEWLYRCEHDCGGVAVSHEADLSRQVVVG
jgi:hypothetical protein